MTFRSIRILFFLIWYLISSTPRRRKIRKLYETDPKEASRLANEDVQSALQRITDISGARIHVTGQENIPEDACLYVANHSSFFDIIITDPLISSGVGYVAKDSLDHIPGLSDWMKLIHCLFLNRTDIKQGLKTILTGVEYLKEGYPMFIFPEGTRSKDGRMNEFKAGSFKMAQRAKVPIVPVAIRGTADLFENNTGLAVKPADVSIAFGKPFLYSDLTKEEKKTIGQYTQNIIQNMMNQM